MKSQIYVSDHGAAQHAIDMVKRAYATGQPHLVIIHEPTPQANSKQKQKAMTIISMIARETGEQDVRYVKDAFLNDMGFFEELVEEMKPMRIGLTDLSKEQLSFFIDRLEQFCAENGMRAHENG